MSVNAMEFDYLYNVVDRLYSRLARRSGLSSCAYWMMYALVRAGGTESLRTLAASWAFSKQTINSALKALEARELIALEFEEGSRKNKRAMRSRRRISFRRWRLKGARSVRLRNASASNFWA